MDRLELTEPLIDLIYDGVLYPASIEAAIKECIRILGARGGNIQVTSKTQFKPLYFAGFGDGYTKANIAAYLDHWQYANAHRDAMRRAYEKDPTQVFLCHEHISETDFKTGAYFQEFFSALGQRWLAGGLARDTPGIEVSIAFSRRHEDPSFGPREAHFIAELLPHIRRSTRIGIKLGLPRDIPGAAIQHGLKSIRNATFLVDATTRIRWQNEAGTKLLTENCGLSTKDGHLKLTNGDADQKLVYLASRVFDQQLSTIPSAFISTKSKNEALELEVVPAAMPKDSLIGAEAMILIMVKRTGLSARVSGYLRTRYGLTPAESSLALLMAEGISIDEAAAYKALSPHTVRTQLKSIFAKTGVTKQTALTALVWRAA